MAAPQRQEQGLLGWGFAGELGLGPGNCAWKPGTALVCSWTPGPEKARSLSRHLAPSSPRGCLRGTREMHSISCCPGKGTDFDPKASSFLSEASRPPLFLVFGYDFRNPCNPCSWVSSQLRVCPKHPRLQGSRRCRKGLALAEALPCRSSNIPLSSTL